MQKSSCLLICLWMWVLSASVQAAEPSSDEQLAAIQAELKARQQALAQSQASADELQQALQVSDKEIADAATRVKQSAEDLALIAAEQKQLKDEQKRLQSAIERQQTQLAAQIKSAFMIGQYDYIKMFFNQDDVGRFERTLSYYQYLSRERQRTIVAFQNDVAALLEVNLTLQKKADALLALKKQQQAQQNELLARQQDRKLTLAQLKRKISTEAAKVEALLATEQALLKAIEIARREAEEAAKGVVALMGLEKSKGKLPVPAEGRVRTLFGKQRQGQVSWNGIVIEGSEGKPVKAISQGRVLYADWLRGMGLVTIVDHGEGFMSVYGHNQALLKQAGDMIERGETIALVGQSGGQDNPTLYFELRHKGKPLNPAQWLAL